MMSMMFQLLWMCCWPIRTTGRFRWKWSDMVMNVWTPRKVRVWDFHSLYWLTWFYCNFFAPLLSRGGNDCNEKVWVRFSTIRSHFSRAKSDVSTTLSLLVDAGATSAIGEVDTWGDFKAVRNRMTDAERSTWRDEAGLLSSQTCSASHDIIWCADAGVGYAAGADKQSRLMLAAEMETKGDPAALERLTEVNDRLLRSGWPATNHPWRAFLANTTLCMAMLFLGCLRVFSPLFRHHKAIVDLQVPCLCRFCASRALRCVAFLEWWISISAAVVSGVWQEVVMCRYWWVHLLPVF